MTLKRIEQLLNLLKSHGVDHFKSVEVEISFGALAQSAQLTSQVSPAQKIPMAAAAAPPTAAAAPPVDMPIPHHVNEVQKLLKLSDNDLVDALFPDVAPPETGE